MTPEERRKRMEERMAAMTPEERAAFQERMAQRQAQGGRGGFGQGQNGQGPNGQGQGGGRGGVGGAQPQGNARSGNSGQTATNQGAAGRGPTRTSRLDSAPTMNTSASSRRPKIIVRIGTATRPNSTAVAPRLARANRAAKRRMREEGVLRTARLLRRRQHLSAPWLINI